MVQSILIPLDGSTQAELALPYGQALARKTGARVRLVQAAWADRPADEHWAETQVAVVREANEYLATVAARLRAEGLEVSTAVPYGGAAEAILDQVSGVDADLVVMATHGRSGLGRWVYGSVAESVLARSHVPVLLVRAGQDVEPAFECQRLVVPLDGSAFSEAALPVARALARTLGAEIVLLRVVPVPEHAIFDEVGRAIATIDQEAERLKTDGQDYLRELGQRLEADGTTVRYEVRVGDAPDAIVDSTQDGCAALVVMATHGRTGLGRLILGSVAGQVLRRGTVPLLLVRPRELERAHAGFHGTGVGAPAGAEVLSYATEDRLPVPEAMLVGATLATQTDWGIPVRSPVERLLNTIEAHINAENESLRAYKDLSKRSGDPLARMLIELVLADEERHHELLHRMAISLRDDINWTHSPDALPIDRASGPVAAELIEATRARIREEQESVRHARELARTQRGLYDGLFELLLQIMAEDSEKHERILRFVLKRLQDAESTPAMLA